MRSKFFLLFCFSLLAIRSNAQEKSIQFCQEGRGCKTIKADSVFLKNLIVNLSEKGYLYCHFNGDTLFSGPKAPTFKVDFEEETEILLGQIGFSFQTAKKRTYEAYELSLLSLACLKQLENIGYPFASVQVSAIQWSEMQATVNLAIDKGPLTVIDSVNIALSSINPKFIYGYLGIKPGDIYHEAAIQRIESRLNELPFFVQKKAPAVLFTTESTRLYLTLEDKKANDINGIIGFQPDANTGNVVFTGDVRLLLQNSFNNGERLLLNWRRLQTNTQDLSLEAGLPYLLGSNFGVLGTAKFYRRDTTFADVSFNGKLQYFLGGRNHIAAFIKTQNSNLISTSGLELIQTLPSYADISKQLFGISTDLSSYDYLANPTKGFGFSASASAGNRRIRQNPAINEAAYTNVDLRTNQYELTMNLIAFWKLAPRFTLKSAWQGGALIGDGIFDNELYRIGGLKSLRGFDEEALFARQYLIQTLEPRFILEQNSNVFLFLDYAYYERGNLGNVTRDNPLAFGGGVNFETKPGIFSITYALGREQNNPFDLRSGKIHFGFINYF